MCEGKEQREREKNSLERLLDYLFKYISTIGLWKALLYHMGSILDQVKRYEVARFLGKILIAPPQYELIV